MTTVFERIWLRWRNALALAVLAWATIFAVLVHIKVFSRAQFGIDVNANLVVTRSQIPGISPQDHLEAVKTPRKHIDFPSVFSWLLFLDEADESHVRLQVRTQGETTARFVEVRPQKRPLFPKLLYMLIPGIVTLLCALYLAYRLQKNPLAPFLVLTEAATYVLVLSYTNLESIAASPPLLLQFFTWNMLAPPALVLFFLRVPAPTPWGRWPRTGWLFVPSLVQYFITIFLYLRLLVSPSETIQWQFLTVARFAIPLVNFGYGIVVAALMLWRVRTPTEKRQGVLYLGYGFVLALLVLTSSAFLHSRDTAVAQILNGNDQLMILYGVLALSLTLSTSSKWTRILERWVNRGFVYGAITVGIVLLYIVLSGFIGLVLTQMFGVTSRIVTVGAAVLSTAGLFSVKHIVQDYIDRLFFRTRYRYAETLRELSERMAGVMELSRLLAQLVRILGENMGLSWASAYRYHEGHLIRQQTWGPAPEIMSIDCPATLLRRLQTIEPHSCVFLASWMSTGKTDAAWIRIFDALHAKCLVVLEFQGEWLGVLALGAVDETFTFSRDELDLLESVAKQASVAMKNALSYSTILHLSESLAAQKREIEQLKSRLEVENVYLRQELLSTARFGDLVGNSPAMLQVRQMIEKVAPTDATVLITGESGTGKELVARTIHALSPRHGRAMVVVNCAAIPETLLESELFGHVKGAFTGATRRKVGQFEIADGSTLFLDEVGDLPLALQVKLLRVLQEREFHPVGSETPVKVDVRIIAATNRDLKAMVQAGTFREDLYYRIHVVPIHLPLLRQRGDDVILLAQYLLDMHARRMGRKLTGFSRAAIERMRAYAWPGNVRELSNVIERAVTLAEGPILDADILLPAISVTSELPTRETPTTTSVLENENLVFDLPYKEAVETFRRRYIARALERTGGNKSEAARLAGVNRPYLHKLIRELGITGESNGES